MRSQALQAPGRDPRLRSDRGARFQPDVRDHRGAGEGGGLDRLSAPRDRAGDLPELQELPAVLPQAASVRDRADRQELPQRDHDRQLHLPHAGIRADGDGVLRAAAGGRAVVRALARAADELVDAARDPARPPAPAPPRRRGALPLLERHERHRVPVPDRLVRARGDRQPRRLRPAPARRALGAEARVRRQRPRATATSPT